MESKMYSGSLHPAAGTFDTEHITNAHEDVLVKAHLTFFRHGDNTYTMKVEGIGIGFRCACTEEDVVELIRVAEKALAGE
jgi:hypothetical protein